jgi:hypothetical protein
MVDDDDYEAVSKFKWYAQVCRRTDGSVWGVYASRMVPKEGGGQTHLLLHRFLLGIPNPKVDIDHEDHDGLNCRRCNLRIATHQQNTQNKRMRCDNCRHQIVRGICVDEQTVGTVLGGNIYEEKVKSEVGVYVGTGKHGTCEAASETIGDAGCNDAAKSGRRATDHEARLLCPD